MMEPRYKEHQQAGNGHDALRHARSLVARGLKGVHIRVTDHRSLSGKGDWRYTIWSERAEWRESIDPWVGRDQPGHVVMLGFPPDGDACNEKLEEAMSLLLRYGQIDGAHHKAWVIDQVARILLLNYDEVIAAHKTGEDGPNTYGWDQGIAP